jgi:hypothetical protein
VYQYLTYILTLQRRSIISGVFDPCTEEKTLVKGIPKFWLNVLLNHPDFARIITSRDEKALKYLTDISAVEEVS